MKSIKKLMLVGLVLLAIVMVLLPLVGCDTNAGGDKPSSTDTPTQQPSGDKPSSTDTPTQQPSGDKPSSTDTSTQEPSGDGGNGATEGTKIKVPEMVSVTGDTIEGNNYNGAFIEGRTVTISDFYMGKYEVTQEEYASVMAGQKVTVDGITYDLESNPSYCTEDSTTYTLFEGDVQGKRPVEGVTWYDAVWYCNALSENAGLTKAYNIEVKKVEQASGKTGYYISNATVTLNEGANGYRLPTEAEWEYAARGGDPTAADWNYTFSGADKAEGTKYNDQANTGLDAVGWYCYNNITGKTGDEDVTTDVSGQGTHQVGKKAANRLGIYDMSGNVREWCYDWYDTITTATAPQGASSGVFRVIRGGSWVSGANSASVSFRYYSYLYYRVSGLGFRVVRASSK